MPNSVNFTERKLNAKELEQTKRRPTNLSTIPFIAQLDGGSEVPPTNNMNATGIAIFRIANNSTTDNEAQTPTSIEYRPAIVEITADYVHSGTEGENGEILGTLYTISKNEFPVMAIFVPLTGNITSADLIGKLAGKQLSDFIRVILDEGA